MKYNKIKVKVGKSAEVISLLCKHAESVFDPVNITADNGHGYNWLYTEGDGKIHAGQSEPYNDGREVSIVEWLQLENDDFVEPERRYEVDLNVYCMHDGQTLSEGFNGEDPDREDVELTVDQINRIVEIMDESES